MPLKMHKIKKELKKKKKICVPTLPKIFKPVTRNTPAMGGSKTEEQVKCSIRDRVLTGGTALCLLARYFIRTLELVLRK